MRSRNGLHAGNIMRKSCGWLAKASVIMASYEALGGWRSSGGSVLMLS